MAKHVDIEKIARGLGAQRRETKRATGGYFGAMQLVADVRTRFKTPKGGGRATDPAWTERRVLPLAEQTLSRLESLAQRVGTAENVRVEPMQVAAIILERTLEHMSDEDAGRLLQERGR